MQKYGIIQIATVIAKYETIQKIIIIIPHQRNYSYITKKTSKLKCQMSFWTNSESKKLIIDLVLEYLSNIFGVFRS